MTAAARNPPILGNEEALVAMTRTGRYALGRDTLVVQTDGVARISYADLAVAMLDLVELAPRPRQRLTVGW